LDKKELGNIMGEFFHKLIWSYWRCNFLKNLPL
jgi:hypothetical protein